MSEGGGVRGAGGWWRGRETGMEEEETWKWLHDTGGRFASWQVRGRVSNEARTTVLASDLSHLDVLSSSKSRGENVESWTDDAQTIF